MAVNGMVKLKSKSEKAKSPMRIYRADFLRSRLLNRATNTKMFPTGIGKYCRCIVFLYHSRVASFFKLLNLATLFHYAIQGVHDPFLTLQELITPCW